MTKTLGLPGTGLYHTSRRGYHTGYHSARSDAPLDLDAQRKANRRDDLTLLIIGLVLLASAAVAVYG